MPSLDFQIVSWPTLGIALLIFGFAPGAVLRLIVLAFPRDDPRRRELLGELYRVPCIERPFWVLGKLEVALFEGLRNRVARRRAHGRSAAIDRAAEEGLPFEGNLSVHPGDVGYSGLTACLAAGITHRQLDYWARTGLVVPSVRSATDSDSQRLYGFRDILVLRVIKRLLNTGVSFQQIRAAVSYLRQHGATDLAQMTLMSDGASVYACTSADDVIDLLQGGQGVFGLALGQIWQEVDRTLMDLPCEPPASGGAAPDSS